MPLFATRTRIAVGFAAAVAALAWVRPSLEARVAAPMGGVGGGAVEDDATPVPRVYFKAPISAEAARVWAKLGQKVPMKYPQETPLEDLIKAIKTATTDKEMPDGLQVYIDPVGLQEAEKTPASPITINLDNVRMETGLKLALKQLDLTFRVHPDGFLIITSTASSDEGEDDPTAMILDKLEALRKQVAELRDGSGPTRRGAAMKAR